MTTGIIGAMDEEIEILLSKMNIERSYEKANMKFNSGTIYDKKVVLVRCGIGKVNAAVCTQILVDDFKVDKVINVGIAGGLGENIYPGDIVIADNLVQHDMDTTAFGDKIGQIPRLNTYEFKCDKELVLKAKDACNSIEGNKNSFVGRIVTGDQFISSEDKTKWLLKEFNALACEMEGGSIAQVCYLNSVPFVVLRSISDNANNGAHMDYKKFETIAIKSSTEILDYMLKN
ncbi:adenosylhomocysteine nucleosidase [Clostridium algifaecis]|uniref:adenosylhomocysteine nucleosidase n=1 Tax=Clostridium algifaecis TaxID=1472040 RepID=A0ABS4KPZ5_9CLOT|nr:5'-methylthioadenosine/adenosylhomocysteine nucleosidase [Clostridium algifaecis]MBP2031446.1 adenosylhomocysteine nucleosidase [Clostridium algifaecis]